MKNFGLCADSKFSLDHSPCKLGEIHEHIFVFAVENKLFALNHGHSKVLFIFFFLSIFAQS